MAAVRFLLQQSLWLYKEVTGVTSNHNVVNQPRNHFYPSTVRMKMLCVKGRVQYVLYSWCSFFLLIQQAFHMDLQHSGDVMKMHNYWFCATDLFEIHLSLCVLPHWTKICESDYLRVMDVVDRNVHTQTPVVKCKRGLITDRGDTLKPPDTDWTCVSVT